MKEKENIVELIGWRITIVYFIVICSSVRVPPVAIISMRHKTKSHYILTQFPVLCQSALNYRVPEIDYWIEHQHKDTCFNYLYTIFFWYGESNSNSNSKLKQKGNCQHTAQHKVTEKELSQCIELFQPSAKHKQMERFSPMHSFSLSIRCMCF